MNKITNASQPYIVKGKKVDKVRQGIVMAEDMEPNDVDLSSFKKQDNLNPLLWENNLLKSRVRLRLLDIADDFFETLKLDWVDIKDIILTGSLSNYTWSEYSDVDLHIIIDFTEVDENIELVKEYVNAQKKVWNEEHDNLKVYGFPVELYVQDINETHNASGVYSLEKNAWVNEPSKIELKDITLEKYIIKEKVSRFVNIINKLEEEFKDKKFTISDDKSFMDKIDLILAKLRQIRKNGLDSEAGEMSIGNVIYKTLRRFGYIDKLYDMKSYSYDLIKSL